MRSRSWSATRVRAGGARTLEAYVYPSPEAEVLDDNLVTADAIYGHQAVPDVVAVAAVGVSSPGTIEPFSSNGPVTHLFPTRTSIPKPDICAPDRVAVSGADGFRTVFVGTSASAPHIAALCALVWSGRPDLPAAAVRSALYASAVDLGAPGRDDVYGWGRGRRRRDVRPRGRPDAPTPTPVQAVTTPVPAVTALAATPTPAAVTTRSPFGKRYAIGDLAGRTVGTGATPRPGSGSTTPGSRTVGTATDPLRPPTRPFIRWYPAARWATTGR